jgi:uncharacterized protein (TIGR03437 family)
VLSRLTCLAASVLILTGYSDTARAQTNSFVISPTSLTFSTQPGFSPFPQTLSVDTSTHAAVTFTITTSSGSGCNTIATSVQSPQTPAQVSVAVQGGSLAAGSYSCSLKFSATGLADVTIPVTIQVGGTSGAGQVSVTPTSLTFSAQTGANPPGAQILTLSNNGAQVNFTATPDSTWLQVSPTNGQVPPATQISVTVNPAGLQPGTYNGNVIISPAGLANITVPVSLTVSGNPTLEITQNSAPVNTTTGLQFYYQTGTSLPGPQILNFASSNASTPIQFSISATGAQAGVFVLSPSGALATPAGVAVSVASTAASLPPGAYQATINISAPGAANPTLAIPVTLTVSNSPLLTTGAPPAPFNFQIGGAAPANQTVQIATTSSALTFNVATNLPSGQSWLLVGPLTGQASAASPATLTISVNPTGLAAGTYSGSVTVTGVGAANQLSIPVTLNVSNSTLLSAAPSALTFSYQTGQTAPGPQVLTVTSSGAPLAFNVAVNAGSNSNCPAGWLSVNQTSGNTGATGSQLQISVNPTGVTSPPQACTGTISITSTGAPNTVQIPVTLIVSSAPVVAVSPPSISLTGQLNNGLTQAVTLQLTSSDLTTALDFTILNPAPWLIVTPTTGKTPANVTVQANTAITGLTIGQNTTTLTITSPSLPSGATISIPVTLTITSNSTLSVSPTSLTFTQASGGAPPAGQTVQIALSNNGTGQFTAVASSGSIGNWLTVSPTSGAAPGAITVSVNGANLSPGAYNGSVVVTVPGVAGSPITIPVTLTVGSAQALMASPAAVTFNASAGGSTATQTISITSSGGQVNFTITKPSTGCDFLTVSPASGTASATAVPVTLTLNPANLPVGTATCALTLSAPGLQSQTINVTVNVTAAIPSITSVLNGASYVPGPIAPGEVVVIFGANIGPATLTPYQLINNNTAFATTLADTQVFFDNIPAPLLYVSANQIGAVVPFEVAGRPNTTVTVKRAGQTSTAIAMRVVDQAPAIFTLNQQGFGQGAIVNQDGRVNGASAPAAKGSVVSIYMTGAGLTFPLVPTGGVTPGSAPLPTLPAGSVTVTIGGQAAQVQYAGAAPLAIAGLYQINVVVPPTAASGNQPVSVTVAGAQTPSNVTLAIQ